MKRSVLRGLSIASLLCAASCAALFGFDPVELVASDAGDAAENDAASDASEAGSAIAYPACLTPSLPVSEISAGATHTCVLFADSGAVRCWGDNQHGELGVGDMVQRNDGTGPDVPIPPAIHVWAGARYTCAQLEDRTIRCWGDNADDSLGLGSDAAAFGGSAADIEAGFAAVDVGDATVTSLALTTSFGAADTFFSPRPTCAVLSNGQLKCWGFGFLGTDHPLRPTVGSSPQDMGSNLLPAIIDGSVTAATTGPSSTCALIDAGPGYTGTLLKCWGVTEYLGIGQSKGKPDDTLGDHANEMLLLPYVDLGGKPRFIAGGAEFHCAVITNGQVKCWGNLGETAPADGVVGDEEGEMGAALAVVPTPTIAQDVLGLAAAAGTVCLNFFNGVICWGSNAAGQLGVPVTSLASADVGDASFVDLGQNDAGQANSVATLSAGAEIRRPSASSPPTYLAHICALLGDKSVKCWGANDYGQLGLGVAVPMVGDKPDQMGNKLPTVCLPAHP